MTATSAIPALMHPAPSEEFTFDRERHICRDMKGNWIISNTQILEAQGLTTDWDEVAQRIGRDRLDRKTKLGTEVHDLTDMYDEFGGYDPSWLTTENEGYCESWAGFRRMSGFVPIYNSVRRVALVNGMRYTMEVDNFGLLHGKYPALLDKKCSEMNPPGWGLQLAGYECGWFNSPRCGRVIRANVRLKADGSPGRLIEHKNHDHDAAQYLAALTNVTWRIQHGLLKEPTE